MKKTFKTSDQLKKELVETDLQIKELTNRSNDLRNKLVTYLDKRSPDEFTAMLYPNTKFTPRALQIHSEKLLLLTRKQEALKEEYMNALRQELIQGFIIEHSEFKSEFVGIEIENTVSGILARVRIK
jgi:hypothetical protein